jgi:hypothetical protein
LYNQQGGTDAYSSAGANAVIEELDKTDIEVLRFVSFEAGTNSVEEQIRSLKSAGCPVVILWGQSGDLKTIVVEADKQGLSASNPYFPVQWFSSEIFLGAFEDVCSEFADECSRVFRGALCCTPNFGPGTESYKKVADAWHAQTTKIGTTNGDRTSAIGCDDRKDVLGKNVWLVDHDTNPLTPDKCAAIDFNDYVEEEASSYFAESSGDGRISMYVPFAYDATIMVATGLHSLFTSNDWVSATTNDEENILYDGKNIYRHMLVSNFDGFSGHVNFRCSDKTTCSNILPKDINIGTNHFEGDRQGSTMDFFLWNFNGIKGEKFVKFGTTRKGGISTGSNTFGEHGLKGCTQTKPMTWPSVDNTPHDETKWNLQPLPNVNNFKSSVVLKDSNNEGDGRCSLPSDRIDNAILLTFDYKYDHPTYFELYVYTRYEDYKGEPSRGSDENKKIIQKKVNVIKVDGAKRSKVLYYSNITGLNENSTIWNNMLYVKMVAIVTVGDKIKVSKSNITLNNNGQSISITASQCSKLAMMINETDCNPSNWKCMECPKTGAICGVGNGFMCDTDDDNDETCNLSKDQCQNKCNGKWWGGNNVLDWIDAVPGYWRNFTAWRSKMKDTNKWIDLNEMRKCKSKYHCPSGENINGATKCGRNFDSTSPMCSYCETGYTYQQSACQSCKGSAFSSSFVLSVVFISIFMICIALKIIYNKKVKGSHAAAKLLTNKPIKKTKKEENDALFRKFNKPLATKLKILLAYSQIIGAWDKELPVNFSEDQVRSNQQISVFANFDLSGLTWIKCLSGGGFMGSYLFATIFPVAVIFVVSCIYVIMKNVVWKDTTAKKGSNEIKRSKAARLKDTMTSAVITFLLVVYPAVSRKCIAYFQCDSDFYDDRSFLISDYHIECWKGAHLSMSPYAYVMVILYPIGLPLVLLLILVRANSKHELFQMEESNSSKIQYVVKIGPEFPVPTLKGARLMGGLYIGYEDECYYYEIIDMMRRLLLTSGFKLLTFVDNDDQLMLWLCFFICTYIAIQGILQPYIQFSADLLAMMLQLCLFLVVFGALNISSLDVPPMTADEIVVNQYNYKVTALQNFVFTVQILGYIIGGCSMIYELYFGTMFCELEIYNANVSKDKQLTKREWLPIYNKKLKQDIIDMEKKMEKKAKEKTTLMKRRNSNKVIPATTSSSSTEEADNDRAKALKSWN